MEERSLNCGVGGSTFNFYKKGRMQLLFLDTISPGMSLGGARFTIFR